MEELRELYQQVILDHNNSPRNYGVIDNPSHYAEGDNPLCGDHIDLYVSVDDDIIKDVSFKGKGCAISKASASLMTSEIKGKTIEEANSIFEKFHDMITTNSEVMIDIDKFGKLAVLAGVKKFPLRVKCASLAWHTLSAALQQKMEKVKISTE